MLDKDLFDKIDVSQGWSEWTQFAPELDTSARFTSKGDAYIVEHAEQPSFFEVINREPGCATLADLGIPCVKGTSDVYAYTNSFEKAVQQGNELAERMEKIPRYQRRFPDYHGDFHLLDGFQDNSEWNDTCPKIEHTVMDGKEGYASVIVWQDYADNEKEFSEHYSEDTDYKRYFVTVELPNDDSFLAVESNDWNVAAAEAKACVKELEHYCGKWQTAYHDLERITEEASIPKDKEKYLFLPEHTINGCKKDACFVGKANGTLDFLTDNAAMAPFHVEHKVGQPFFRIVSDEPTVWSERTNYDKLLVIPQSIADKAREDEDIRAIVKQAISDNPKTVGKAFFGLPYEKKNGCVR